jgi:hypothetical protein
VGVDRDACVADEQGARVPVGDDLAFLLTLVDAALLVEPYVAVSVDEAGDDEGSDGDGLSIGDRLVTDPAGRVDPEVALHVLGQHHTTNVQRRRHRDHSPREW